MIHRALIQGALAIIGMLLAGCQGTTPGGAVGTLAPPLSAFSREEKLLFVAGLGPGVVYFTANIHAKNPPVLGEITDGITRAEAVWVDNKGTLYITNSNGSQARILEFRRGSSSPFKTITQGLFTPGAVAVDASGNLYITDFGPSVLVYPAGSSSPSETIAIPFQGRTPAAGGLAFDRKGNLLVATFEVEHNVSEVYRITPGSWKITNLNLAGLTGNALGTDRAGYIYDGGNEGTLSIYAPGSKTPSRTLYAGTTGFYSLLTVTPNGTIYWPNYQLGEMFEFAPGATGPSNTFEGGGVDAAVGSW